jgi:hypothetical protein
MATSDNEDRTVCFAASIALSEIRAAGRSAVRRRLEALVNADVLGLAGAQKVYKDAFGGTLIGIKTKKTIVQRVFGG